MTSAKERAVEAGARAMICDETFPHDVATMVTARSLTKAALRAAFPILAEDIAAWHDERAAEWREREGEADRLGRGANLAAARHERKLHETYASALRARIQQMAEAL